MPMIQHSSTCRVLWEDRTSLKRGRIYADDPERLSSRGAFGPSNEFLYIYVMVVDERISLLLPRILSFVVIGAVIGGWLWI
jgi:hypothetical protein